jgi:hypothetical protein
MLKRSFVAAALVGMAALAASSAHADPLFYKTRPGSTPPSSSAARRAGIPAYRSYSYGPSTTRSYSYAPANPQTVRSYSYSPGSGSSSAPRVYYQQPNGCYCYPR